MSNREEAIDILTRMSTNHFYGHREQEAFKLGAEALKQRWIPVTKKLPDTVGIYLVTFIDRENGKSYVDIGLYSPPHDGFSEMWGHKGVIAWMPLPEPYKGGGEE